MILLWAENHNEEPLVLQFRCPGLFYLCITPWCHITFIRKTHGPSLVARIPDGVVRNYRRIKAEILKGYGIEECMNEMKKKCKSKKEKEGKKIRGGRGHGCHSVSSSKPWPPNKQFQKRVISILVNSTIQNWTSTVYYENAVARWALCRSRGTNFP